MLVTLANKSIHSSYPLTYFYDAVCYFIFHDSCFNVISKTSLFFLNTSPLSGKVSYAK